MPTPVPPLPSLSRADPEFRSLVNALFMTHLPAFTVNINTLATELFDAAVQAAAAQAGAAAAAQAAAVVATKWVSGATYAAGDVRWSGANYQSFRRTVAGAGTLDPSLDTNNWMLLGDSAATPVDEVDSNRTGVLGVVYLIKAACRLTLPAPIVPGKWTQFANVSGLVTPEVDFGTARLNGQSSPGVMVLDSPFASRRLRSSGNPLIGWVSE